MISSIYPASGAHVRIAKIAAAAIISCTAFAAAQAASAPPVKDTFITLSLPGVIGNFTQVPNAPANAIEVLALSAGASCFAAPGSACTNPNIASLSLSKVTDDASPKLFLALVTGVTYATATINFWQAPTSGTSYTKTYTIVMTQASLQSDQVAGGEGGSPSESLSLGFVSIGFQDNLNGGIGCYNVSTKASSSTSITC
jgi:type VI protein secretion system component Hcp